MHGMDYYLAGLVSSQFVDIYCDYRIAPILHSPEFLVLWKTNVTYTLKPESKGHLY